MVPTLKKFMAAHGLDDVTIVADSGMNWDANMRAIDAQGLSFILGMKTPDVPYVVKQWRQNHSRPGDPPSARSIPAPAGPITADIATNILSGVHPRACGADIEPESVGSCGVTGT